MLRPLVGKMRCEAVDLNVMCDFECWRGGYGTKFVVSVVIVLLESVGIEMM